MPTNQLRFLFLTVVFGLSVISRAQTMFEVFQNGKKIGTAKYTVKLNPKSKTTLIETNIGNFTILEASTVDRLGQQTVLFSSSPTLENGKQVVSTINVTIDSKGTAKVIGKTPKQTGQKTVPFPKKGKRRDLSEYWFINANPSPGTWNEFYTFDAGTGQWLLTKTTFVGKRPVTTGGKTVQGNLIAQVKRGRTSSFWLDNKGQLLKIESGSFRMERKW